VLAHELAILLVDGGGEILVASEICKRDNDRQHNPAIENCPLFRL